GLDQHVLLGVHEHPLLPRAELQRRPGGRSWRGPWSGRLRRGAAKFRQELLGHRVVAGLILAQPLSHAPPPPPGRPRGPLRPRPAAPPAPAPGRGTGAPPYAPGRTATPSCRPPALPPPPPPG